MGLSICTDNAKESCQLITDLQRGKTFNSLSLNGVKIRNLNFANNFIFDIQEKSKSFKAVLVPVEKCKAISEKCGQNDPPPSPCKSN